MGLLVAGMLLLGARAWRGIQAHQTYPPDFDEAIHVLPVLQIAADVRRLDLPALCKHTCEQDQLEAYPFFHSWLVAPFFLLGSINISTARLASLVFFGLALVINFFLAGELADDKAWRWLAGLVGAGAMLFALPLWAYASLVYLESAGLMVSLGALFCYLKAEPEDNGRTWPLLCSGLAAAALFTKYGFGLFLLGGVALAELLGWILTRRILFKRWFYLFGPCLLLAALWFANPAKSTRFWEHSRAQDANMSLWNIKSLLFYPHSLARHYVVGPLSLGLVLLGLGLCLRRLRQHRCRAVLACLLVSLSAVTLVPQKEIRFAYTFAPIALALGGAAAAWLAARSTTRLRSSKAKYIVALLFVLLLGWEGRAVTKRLSYLETAQELVFASAPDTQHALDFVLAHSSRPHLLNPWHLFSRYALAWTYYTGLDAVPARIEYRLATVSLSPEPTDENLDALLATLAMQSTDVLVSIDGSPAGDYTGWQVVEPLWARGDLTWLASSERYMLTSWAEGYEGRVLAGDFKSRAEFEALRQKSRQVFQIQLHVYRLRAP